MYYGLCWRNQSRGLENASILVPLLCHLKNFITFFILSHMFKFQVLLLFYYCAQIFNRNKFVFTMQNLILSL